MGLKRAEILEIVIDGSLVSAKECRKCGVLKSLTEYHSSKRTFDGRATRCKSCEKERSKAKYSQNIENEISKDWTNDEFDKVLKSMGGDFVRLSNVSKGSDKVTLKCSSGHVREFILYKFLINKKCPSCGAEKGAEKTRLSYADIRKKFKEKGLTLLSKEYKNTQQKLSYICACGSVSEVSYNNFSSGHHLCKECGIKSSAQTRSLEYNVVEKAFKDRGYTLLDKAYKNNRTKMQYICPNHPEKKVFISYGKLIQGRGCRYCKQDLFKGESNPRYNPEMTKEEREKGRKYTEYHDWRKSVFERDEYTCQTCGNDESGNLNAHHLDGYSWCKEKRTDVSNGITLCKKCHNDFHFIYGYGNNTKEQYETWSLNKLNEIGNRLTDAETAPTVTA